MWTAAILISLPLDLLGVYINQAPLWQTSGDAQEKGFLLVSVLWEEPHVFQQLAGSLESTGGLLYASPAIPLQVVSSL